jgi:hypothetical protein
MKKILNSIFLLSAVSFLLFSCEMDQRTIRGNNDIVEVEYELEDFNELFIDGIFVCHLIPSDKVGMTIEADENLIDYLEITNNDGQLKVKSLENLKSEKGVHVYIQFKELKKITSYSIANIQTESALSGESLSIVMGGAGKLDLQTDVKSIDIAFSGAGLVNLEGSAQEMRVSMSGAGSLQAEDLVVAYAKVALSGVGSAEVNATETLEASVSGIGVINYVGEPKEVISDVSGLGKVKAKS